MSSPEDFNQSADYVQSLHRGLEVIRAFNSERPAMTLSELAECTGLSRAVVRRLLLTLQYLGYVTSRGRLFSLSPRILELGFAYLGSLPVTELAQPLMQALSDRVGESCSLSVLDGFDIVYVQRVAVRKVMTVSLGAGARLPAFCASMGRVLLSGLADTELDAWLAEAPIASRTPYTVTEPARLHEVIAGVRDQGYCYVEQELELGLCSLSVPVRDGSGRIAYALNIGLPYGEGVRERALAELLPELTSTAEAIGRSLAASH
ncbi:IclR family transcriptional regulator domain-containing protein [Microbulbifer pacificus]|uniref:IclR family transcriptional regulator C-terminal domain-containing protein n=1 Tax=Microbulbifer pacificus TaxID=407164 RepID=A0AAU0N2M4_9GAMM|nr:IclR family transcriptional regulator C-terminal domain-containing protein [Microbulbifer pacificus]WOX07222.1 IclR family transcriptional regulator C-terminal domain-containing protein [Microbulbifer pacificus]